MSIEHPHIVAGPLHTPKDGQCVWMYHYAGVWLHCDERAIPGDPWLCADHLVEYHAHPDRVTDRRVFPATPVTIPDKEQAK